jgi:hypothetical protein
MKKLIFALLLLTSPKVNAQNISYLQNFKGDTVRIEKARLYCYTDPRQMFEPYQYYKTVDGVYFRIECDGYIMFVDETQELYTCKSLSYNNVSSHLLYMLGVVRSKSQQF